MMIYHLILIMTNDRKFPQKYQTYNQQMEIIPFKASGENIDNAHFFHFLFNRWILTDIQKNQETNEE